jgi:hypothetical protein
MVIFISYCAGTYSKNATDPKFGFFSWLKNVMNEGTGKVAAVLGYHPKIIARKVSVSRLTGRSARGIPFEMRIPLPWKCRHQFASKDDGDLYFFGSRVVEYGESGEKEVWQHFELIRKSEDNFKLDEVNREDATTVLRGTYDAASIAGKSCGFLHGAGVAPPSFMVNLNHPRPGGMSVTGMEVDVIDEEDEYLERTTTATTPTKYKLSSGNLKSPPPNMDEHETRPRVLMEEVSHYSGRAMRDKAKKKRKAVAQDNCSTIASSKKVETVHENEENAPDDSSISTVGSNNDDGTACIPHSVN